MTKLSNKTLVSLVGKNYKVIEDNTVIIEFDNGYETYYLDGEGDITLAEDFTSYTQRIIGEYEFEQSFDLAADELEPISREVKQQLSFDVDLDLYQEIDNAESSAVYLIEDGEILACTL